MTSTWWFLALAVLAACSGESVSRERPGTGTGGTGADAGAGAGMAGAGAGAGGMSPYAPRDPNVPPDGDGTLEGGSFEGGLGDGWDLCTTSRAGLVLISEGTPSYGERFFNFDSAAPCERCAEDTGDYQITLWWQPQIPAGETVNLYFDIVNFASTPPTGVLLFGTLGRTIETLCSVGDVLAGVPLADLAPGADWQTRCVSFTHQEPLDTFGFYVGDGTFDIGLDALRFGPPCHD